MNVCGSRHVKCPERQVHTTPARELAAANRGWRKQGTSGPAEGQPEACPPRFTACIKWGQLAQGITRHPSSNASTASCLQRAGSVLCHEPQGPTVNT